MTAIPHQSTAPVRSIGAGVFLRPNRRIFRVRLAVQSFTETIQIFCSLGPIKALVAPISLRPETPMATQPTLNTEQGAPSSIVARWRWNEAA
jgi:hypothetical protein